MNSEDSRVPHLAVIYIQSSNNYDETHGKCASSLNYSGRSHDGHLVTNLIGMR